MQLKATASVQYTVEFDHPGIQVQQLSDTPRGCQRQECILLMKEKYKQSKLDGKKLNADEHYYLPTCSVSNGSGRPLRVRVWVRTNPFPNGRSGSSIHPNNQFGYHSMDIPHSVSIGRVARVLSGGSICRFI